MTQAAFEPIAASQRLLAAGLPAEQAEAVVEAVSEVNVVTQQVADDLSDLKSYIQENMVIRDDLKDFTTRDDFKDFATRDDFKDFATRDDLKDLATRDDLSAFVTREMLTADLAVLKSEIFRFGFIATGILGTLILGLASMIAAMSVAALWR